MRRRCKVRSKQTMESKRAVCLLVLICVSAVGSFRASPVARRIHQVAQVSSSSSDDCPAHSESRRRAEAGGPARQQEALQPVVAMGRREVFKSLSFASSGLAVGLASVGSESFAADSSSPFVYKPARRPTAYRVDSTIPPTLLPLRNAGRERKVLEALGRGSGTEKDAIVVDTVNLNNMLNKAVFGTVDAVSSLTSGNKDESRSGPGYASFVCLGVPSKTRPEDIELTSSILGALLDARKSLKSSTALGLAFCPYSAQAALGSYLQGGSDESLVSDLSSAGVSEEVSRMYLPLLRAAKSRGIDLLAMSPEMDDIRVTRSRGLQEVDPGRRSAYVVDAEGFVALPNDPRYQLYTDRSLFKDFEPTDARDTEGGYFAERILVHEAAATAAATYAAGRPESLVALVAPTPDLRFLGGINGRIPRVCRAVNPASKVTDDAVTTILLNPTAEETLSRTRYLRLEIGTGPDTLQYQTKVADYLWFSATPKVNLIPRLMEG